MKKQNKYYMSLVGYCIFGEKAETHMAGRIELWGEDSHYDIDEITYWVLRTDYNEFMEYFETYEYELFTKDELIRILSIANEKFKFTECNIIEVIEGLY